MTTGHTYDWVTAAWASQRRRKPNTAAATAWLPADKIRADLSCAEQDAVYVPLGSGNTEMAMTRMFTIGVRHLILLPASIISEIDSWLDGYVGDRDDPRRLFICSC